MAEEIIIRQVITHEDMRIFAGFANKLYDGNQFYVPDFESDIIEGLNPKTNPASSFTSLLPLLAYKNSKPVGRVVGIINRKANKKWGEKTMRFGYFDFIDDIEVAHSLLEAVADWGRKNDMTMMEGPMGITDFDKEGMLVSDFDMTGTVNTYYNAPYYPEAMDKLGFIKRADWVQVRVPVPAKVPLIYTRIAERAARLHKITLRQVTNKEIRNGLGLDVFHLFNEAYARLFGFSEFTDAQAQQLIDRYIWLVDKRLMPVLFNDKGELVGAAITMGSLSMAMQKAKGKLWPIGWWHLLRSLLFHHESTVDMLLIGIRPDYQGTGINAMFFDHLVPIYNSFGFKFAETGPQLETNHRELSQWKYLGAKTVKRRRCYVKSIV